MLIILSVVLFTGFIAGTESREKIILDGKPNTYIVRK